MSPPKIIALFLLATSHASFVAASGGELAVIVSRELSVSQVDSAMLKQIFTVQQTYWPDGTAVVPVNYAPGDPLRAEFDQVVLGLPPERVGEYWIDQLVRARAKPPMKVPSPALAAQLVIRLKGVIAYVPASMVGPDVKVVAFVRGGRVLAQ